jgi:glycerol-3-phosphate acyltransferase PlsX
MSKNIRISVDAMGGDNGAQIVLHGAQLALKQCKNIEFIFHGQSKILTPLLEKFPDLKPISSITDCEMVISMNDKPSNALRKGRGKSSMWSALQAVKDGKADVAISGGNTGALMAMATFCLRPIEGISRPAIAAIWPSMKSKSVVLDVGATVGGDAKQLVDFAVLGGALARALFHKKNPTIGLLNVGVEEVKGLEPVKEAAAILSNTKDVGFTYHGFVEGDDIGKGTVDVVVTEGFTGNIALKTAEGTARQVGSYLRNSLESSLVSKIGAFIAQKALRAFKAKMDPRAGNGGVFLGLNGIVIKSHGGTDEIGFKSALCLAHEMAEDKLLEKISYGMQHFPTLLSNENVDAGNSKEEKK